MFLVFFCIDGDKVKNKKKRQKKKKILRFAFTSSHCNRSHTVSLWHLKAIKCTQPSTKGYRYSFHKLTAHSTLYVHMHFALFSPFLCHSFSCDILLFYMSSRIVILFQPLLPNIHENKNTNGSVIESSMHFQFGV